MTKDEASWAKGTDIGLTDKAQSTPLEVRPKDCTCPGVYVGMSTFGLVFSHECPVHGLEVVQGDSAHK